VSLTGMLAAYFPKHKQVAGCMIVQSQCAWLERFSIMLDHIRKS
jgi:hypothetical protein